MALHVYNTFTEKAEIFKTVDMNKVKIFVCGPTVYDFIHLGHARTYIFYDVVARYLKYLGYKIQFIINITDIEDKIFARAHDEGKDYREITEKYTKLFYQDLKRLGIDTVTLFAPASKYISEIIEQIQVLVDKGYAYKAGGNIFYDTAKFPKYGSLSHQSRIDLMLRRLDVDPKKKDQTDFILWRKADEEPSWPSKFGKGRPGWHIEDTAISITHFGARYDIHGGASELIFPHHEAEIAQAMAYTGENQFVNYWVHTGLLTIDGMKMSKSLGNYVTVRETLRKYSADALRLSFLSVKYKNDMNFTDKTLNKSDDFLKMLRKITKISTQKKKEKLSDSGDNILIDDWRDLTSKFRKAMDDDFNTPKAINILKELALSIHQEVNPDSSMKLRKTAREKLIDPIKILGLSF